MEYNQIPATVPYGGPEVPQGIDPTMTYGQQMYPEESQTHSQGEYTELNSFLADGGNHFGVSSLCFDSQELLWMGNQGGHLTSYYGCNMQKYTSFQVHASEEIRQIVPLAERGVLSLTQSSLQFSIRRGLPEFVYSGPNMHDMQCMLLTSSSKLLIGGHHTTVLELDLEKLQENNQYKVEEPGCAIFRMSNKYICAGDTSGKVTLFDPSTMKPEHVLDAHSGTLSDFDLHGNLLVTCGFSNRLGHLTPDRFLMVYDMRMMRPMTPLQLLIDPTFLRFVPTYSSRVAIVSQAGQFQLVEPTGLTSIMMYQLSALSGIVMSFDVSSTCQALAFGDSSGYIHLFGSSNDVQFNTFHHETEFASPVEAVQSIHIDDEFTPLSMIPMMYPAQRGLLSDWPDHLCKKVYRKPKSIDPDILRSTKMYQGVGYAPNPGKERRNQVPYKLKQQKTKKGKSNVPESPLGRDDPFVSIPKRYRKVDLKYSKLGLEDFDFRIYNKTFFAGLENHIPNVYCNNMLQMLYFIEPVRVALLNHLCAKEFCLSCELGFLFHMFDKQKGHTCQASNFLRAFRTLPEAAALGLVLAESEENAGKVNLGRLIQSWQRFMHQQIHSETCIKLEDSHDSSQEIGSDVTSSSATSVTEEKPPEPSPSPTTMSAASSTNTTTTTSSSSKSKKKKKKSKKKEDKEKDKDKDKEKPEKEPETEPAPKPETEPQPTQPEENTRKDEQSVISSVFGLETMTTLRCKCGQETQRKTETTLINMRYPDCSPPGPNKGPVAFNFAQVVEHSLTLEQNTQAWCNICNKYQPHSQRKEVLSLPDVMALNCQLENARDLEFWKIQLMLLKQKEEAEGTSSASSSPIPQTNPIMCRYGNNCTRKGCKFRHERDAEGADDLLKINPDDDKDPGWISLGLKVTLLEDGRPLIEEISEEEPLPKEMDSRIKYYQLLGTVAHIKDIKTGGNLVSHINAGETYHQRKEGVTCTQWYLFNDFSITPIEKEEAIQYNLEWKVPCTIYFIRRDICKVHDLTIVNPINSSVLFDDSMVINASRRVLTFTPLQEEELPKKEELIGLDAEFVSLNQEESELRSDGTRSTIKPSHMSAARVTCIRGQGEMLGQPFLDDYISTQEQVVDYLTQYSGIKHGDLDPNISTKNLTTLKSIYIKLRYLIDSGVVFVGHGLKKDFRVLNILVPKNQIIDTVDLFHIPRQRMISLKFLAWYFLKTNIQSITHDSAEDALTALQLHFKYQEMAKEGADKVRATIKELYEFGRKNQWKIPDLEEEDTLDTVIPF